MKKINYTWPLFAPLVLSSLLAVFNASASDLVGPAWNAPEPQVQPRSMQGEDTPEIDTLSVWEKSVLGSDWEQGLNVLTIP